MFSITRDAHTVCARTSTTSYVCSSCTSRRDVSSPGGVPSLPRALHRREQEIKWAYTAIDEVLPTDVHMAMVIPALQYQTSPEQREKWLPLATSFKILGAYVQTELGHGSNVRALETTATFDQVLQTVD